MELNRLVVEHFSWFLFLYYLNLNMWSSIDSLKYTNYWAQCIVMDNQEYLVNQGLFMIL